MPAIASTEPRNEARFRGEDAEREPDAERQRQRESGKNEVLSDVRREIGHRRKFFAAREAKPGFGRLSRKKR